ncbi:MAG: glycosyltransferase [Gemmatimonadaceae bacterium]|nr:glycosyltransferase [Gemmatimonadaceae bacterium]
MKILFVAPYLPSPARFGGQRRIDGLMRGLAQRHDVSILSFNADDEHGPGSIDATRAYCDQVTTVPGLDAISVPGKRKLQLHSMLSTHSFEHLQATRRADFQAQIDAHLERTAYDVVQVEFANMASFRYARRGRRPLLVLDEHNIEYDLQRRSAGAADGITRLMYNSLNWRKLAREERSAWRRFDGVVLTSARDRELLHAAAPGTNSVVVPNGVDVAQFQPSASPVDGDTIVFFGANNYFPNHNALLYFIDEILPKVVARRPMVKLQIIGPGVQPAVLERRDPNVEIVGFVDDVLPYLERAAAIVVPLRVGGGTRLKIVEAMAKSKAIISTHIGAEGIDVTHGHDVLLADTPADFAQHVLTVLADPALGRALGANARELAVNRYAWPSIVAQLEAFYGQLSR